MAPPGKGDYEGRTGKVRVLYPRANKSRREIALRPDLRESESSHVPPKPAAKPLNHPKHVHAFGKRSALVKRPLHVLTCAVPMFRVTHRIRRFPSNYLRGLPL